MAFVRSALMVVMAVALAAYGFDCPVTSTADEAMQCCDTMGCSSPGHQHSDDCCKTMPTAHSPFMQAHSTHTAHVLFSFLAFLPASTSQGLDFLTQSFVAAHSHAPPISQSAIHAPLRI